MFGVPDVIARPADPAELAQARVFEKVLRAEFAELNRMASTMAARRTEPNRCDIGSSKQSAPLSRIHARIGEVHRLLDALQDRFPHMRLAGELPSAPA